MRIALTIHLFMLGLLGGLAWHIAGSPSLLVASIFTLFVHWLLIKKERPVERIASVLSALLLGFSALHGTTEAPIPWLLLLALPQLLSATGCLWEIAFKGSIKAAESTISKRFIFTLGFYSSLGLTFLLMSPESLNLEPAIGRVLAVISALLGFIAWETSREKPIKLGITPTLTDRESLVLLTIIGLGALLFAIMFTVALPLVADSVCDLSTKLNPPKIQTHSKSDKNSSAQVGSDGPTSNDELDSTAGPQQINRSGEIRLPMRGNLELSDEPRVILKFEDPAQGESLARRSPLYVRTFALSKFEDGHWERENRSGRLLKDSTDGRSDGRVEVSSLASPSDVGHEVMLLQSNGIALPALAGVTTFALPELSELADDWFQNGMTGDLRYKAWSKPIDMVSLSKSPLEPGSPGPAYLAKLDTPFGSRLTKIGDSLATGRDDLNGRIEKLRQFFETQFTYSPTIENPNNRAPLENFLFEEKRGYCDFFASAAALILRHMGIPSRVANGYKEGEHDASTDTWTFRELHAHTWTEVFIKGQGWVICEFTPSSDDSPPRFGTPPTPANTAGATSQIRLGKLWSQTGSLQSLRTLPILLSLGFVVASLGLLFLKPSTPEQRASKLAARKRVVSEQQPAFFLEFLRMCRSFGHPHPAGQTLKELHRELKQTQFCHNDFDDLTTYYYQTRYENVSQDAPRERQFLKQIRQFWKAKSRETDGLRE